MPTRRDPRPIGPTEWAKDHWSTFAYVNARVAQSDNGIGFLNNVQLRCDEHRHPWGHHGASGVRFSPSGGERYPTRLKNNREEEGHDDWDCLYDLEREGFIGMGTNVSGAVWLTDKGREALLQLQRHKQEGGNYTDFVYRDPVVSQTVTTSADVMPTVRQLRELLG